MSTPSMSTVLNISATSQSSTYQIVLNKLGGPSSKFNPLLNCGSTEKRTRKLQVSTFLIMNYYYINNLREKFSSSTRWRSNHMNHPNDSLGQARILLLLDPHYPPGQYQWHLSVMEENIYVALLLSGVFMLTTHIGKF